MTIIIDKIDKTLLYELDKNCRISDTQLAKIVRRSRESVRMRIKKLEKSGVIQSYITSINPSKLGYLMFKMYFQLLNKPEEIEKFYSYLKSQEGIYWFGTNDGVWDMHMTLYCKDLESFNNLKNEIYTRWNHLITKRAVGVLVMTKQYPKKYLSGTINDNETYFAGKPEQNRIDELEKNMINILIKDARIPMVQLARNLNCSIDIIRGRMKKLEEIGILTQYRIALDHNKLGMTMFKAFLYFDNISLDDKKKLLEYGKQHRNILYVIEQISNWDFEIEIMAESYQSFTLLMNEIKHMFKDSLRNYEFALMREDIWVLNQVNILG